MSCVCRWKETLYLSNHVRVLLYHPRLNGGRQGGRREEGGRKEKGGRKEGGRSVHRTLCAYRRHPAASVSSLFPSSGQRLHRAVVGHEVRM